MKKIAIFIITIFLITACTPAAVYKPKEEKQIKRIDYFEYNYGSEETGYYEYIIKEDQYYRLIVKTLGNTEFNVDIDKYITLSDVNELSALVDELDLKKWNNFSENEASSAADKSFNLRIAFRDNSYIGAKGLAKFPDDYAEKSARIISFLEKLSQKA